MGEAVKSINLLVPEEMLAAIDEARGSVPRIRWIRDVIEAELRRVAPRVFTGNIGFPPGVHPPAGGVLADPSKLVFVDDPLKEQTIPLSPEAKARSAAIWEETGRRLAEVQAAREADPLVEPSLLGVATPRVFDVLGPVGEVVVPPVPVKRKGKPPSPKRDLSVSAEPDPVDTPSRLDPPKPAGGHPFKPGPRPGRCECGQPQFSKMHG